jgi:hypothetical protein
VVPPQASVLLARLDRANQDQVAAEVRKLETIHELCLAYHAVDEDAFGEAAEKLVHYGADGTPGVAEYLSLEVAALLGMSPASGAGLIGQVLNCVYRHPLMWDAVRAGRVRWYRATEIISAVNAAQLCHDAAIWVDEQLAPSLATLSRRRILNLAKGYVALADVDAAREREDAARAARHVWVAPGQVFPGACLDVSARLDATDALTLDATLSQLAAVLASDGDESSLDHRRASALGILADPSRAFQLLQGLPAASQQRATIVVHVTPDVLDSDVSIARIESLGALTRDSWVELLGQCRVTVRPVIDLNAIKPIDSYEIPDRIREAVTWRSPIDVFPYGTRAAQGLDLDHTIPYDHSLGAPPGQTRIDNLAPLSRKAHRAKTARRWKLTQAEGGWLEWTSPAGYHYATGPYGTLREIRMPATAA